MEMLPVRGCVEITSIDFFNPTKKTVDLQAGVKFSSDVDLGWTSSTTVSLHYGSLLVGEVKLDDTYIKPNESNETTLTLKDFEIWNMHGFKAFIQRVVPRSRGNYQQRNGGPAVSLEMDERGHQLSMSIDLDAMGFAKALEPRVRRNDDKLAIDFFIENTTKVELLFSQAYFILEQNGCTLAKLEGVLNITSWEERKEVGVEGSIPSDTTLYGKAILKGVGVEDEDRHSWYIHAIRLFEMEVDLDAIIYGEHYSPRE
ncbi:hypothetical protein TGAMA5MH_10886 [Trichoderma gamsii]|uniref:Uncharacterized protein n=1 Tax=Trichoderma gamsii TaxID=398673 RepID=A0A2K0SVC9_9HYPO|nr:hypothetical protein TGAMA5MH_10886 [Trichoderma gamsii]